MHEPFAIGLVVGDGATYYALQLCIRNRIKLWKDIASHLWYLPSQRAGEGYSSQNDRSLKMDGMRQKMYGRSKKGQGCKFLPGFDLQLVVVPSQLRSSDLALDGSTAKT